MALAEKLRIVSDVISSVEKQFGKGAIMRLGVEASKPEVSVIPTGSITLDKVLGIGGYPRGRIVELFGPESAGKSTLALHAVLSCQQQDGIAAYIDTEHALDLQYAEALGVDIESLLLSQPDTGEQALEIVDVLSRSSAVDLIVVDSVAALIPQAELEGDMGAPHMGLQARLMSQALRKLVGTLSKSKTTVIFINQIRHKIGVFFGSPETTPGGNALKFFSSVRMDIRRIGSVKQGDTVTGHRARVKVIKNKLASPFQEAHFEIRYGKGIYREAECLDLGVEKGIIEKSGAWYSYEGERLGQGREKVCQVFRERPELLEKLSSQLMGKESKEAPKAPEADPEQESSTTAKTKKAASKKKAKGSRKRK